MWKIFDRFPPLDRTSVPLKCNNGVRVEAGSLRSPARLQERRSKRGPGGQSPPAWSLYTCGIDRAGVGCPRFHLGLGNVRPPRGRCLGLCPRRLRHRLKCGRGTLGSGAVLWFGVRCRLAQGCRGQLDDSPQSLGVGPEGAAQEQPNVERWVGGSKRATSRPYARCCRGVDYCAGPTGSGLR